MSADSVVVGWRYWLLTALAEHVLSGPQPDRRIVGVERLVAAQLGHVVRREQG